MIIIFIIIIIIVCIEVYSYFINRISIDVKKEIKVETLDIASLMFDKIDLSESCVIDISNCYIYTTSNENLFLIKDTEYSLIEIDQVYNILDTAKIDFIFIKNVGNYYIAKK